jgi:hypothetical protein
MAKDRSRACKDRHLAGRKFSAVDGAMPSAEVLARLVDSDCMVSDSPTSHTQLTRPAIGCFLSHLQIWQAFVASGNDGHERLVILEDDAVPAPAYWPRMRSSFCRPFRRRQIWSCLVVPSWPAWQKKQQCRFFRGSIISTALMPTSLAEKVVCT